MRQRPYDSRRESRAAEDIGNIENRIRHQLSGRLRDFRLEVADAGIVLHGRARTYYAKQLAQHAIMAAIALPILRNEIEVV
jgi:hypothetical protein